MYNKILNSCIIKKWIRDYLHKIEDSLELREKYFVNPTKDFTRVRKLTFAM